VQFILQLKLSCLHTIVNLLLEEFKNFSQVILKYTIMSHDQSYRVGVRVGFWARSRSRSRGVLNFLTHVVGVGVAQKRSPHPWLLLVRK